MNNKFRNNNNQETVSSLQERIEQLENIIRQMAANSTTEMVDVADVRSDDYITVMSLSNIPLNLSTQGHGKGKVFRFSKFGETKNLLFSDLLDIIEYQRSFLENGLFYIANNLAIRKLGLNDLYSKILTKEKMEQILRCDNYDIVSIYSSANQRQKEVLNEMIVEKLASGENLDLNIIGAISRISKVDFLGKAEELKNFK